ncbi:MAG: hypothetical protein HZA61_10795 [Candidatus Eisenbacteria bacterium]|uniref:Uncharacterized protein n=1 Tax=Eiseniibacteriota bacterium TaxID=2212470 RepID=A0A933SCF0_UNCEI|nr:hypothetical protein [Candidatus Eisenbacteria bacterium]
MKAKLAAGVAPAGAALVALWLHARDVRAPFLGEDWALLDATRGRSLFAALAAPDPLGDAVRPLGRQAWFWALDRLGGGAPEVFHAANLALFLIAVLLLAALAHRVAGPRAAAVAAPLFALTHAADVPLLWASGAQDLLALTLALAALLALEASAALAAALFLAALLAKETVVLLPVVALVLARRGHDWGAALRRTLPCFGVLALWAFTAGARAIAHGLHLPADSGPWPTHAAAALAAFLRTLAGAETGATATLRRGAIVAIALAALLACVPAVFERGAPPHARTPDRPAIALGALWAIAGVMPVAAVAPRWRAHHFLFALAGAALALGAACAAAPPWAGAVLVAALGLGSAQARTRSTHAPRPDAWSTLSHVNRAALSAAGSAEHQVLAELKRLHPALDPGTVLFGSGLPPEAGFALGGGALVRVAYADTSLRAYALEDLNVARVRRGPVRILRWSPQSNSLEDTTTRPGTFVSVALAMLVRDEGDAVDGALEAARASGTLTSTGEYLAAWRAWERGERVKAGEALAALGFAANGPADEDVREAAAIARGDSIAAGSRLRTARQGHVLDAAVQGLFADFTLPDESLRTEAVLAAYASRVLAPEFPYSWRRWASVQLLGGHYALAKRSLERYFELAPEARAQDAEALVWLERLAQGTAGPAVP